MDYVLEKEMHYYKPQEVIIEKLEEPLSAAEQPNDSAPVPIKSRDDVYTALQELANFLKQTEPHSPVPPILNMLILWKDLALQDIISQIQNSPAQYQLLHTIVGK